MLPTIKLSEAVGALVTGHIVVSGIGIVNAAVTAHQPPPTSLPTEPNTNAAAVQRVVAKMYSGGGLDAPLCSPSVSFTDPAACCTGRAEVTEAFRALRVCDPEHLTSPTVLATHKEETHLALHQRYFAGSYLLPRGLVVRSTLVVCTNGDGLITSLEEQWNGGPLLQWSAFRFSRRVNGILSSLLTPLAV